LLTSPLRIPRPRLIDFITGIKTSPHVHIIHVDTTLDTQAWQPSPSVAIKHGVWLIVPALSSCSAKV